MAWPMPELPPVTSTFLPRRPGSPTAWDSALMISAMGFSSESGFGVQSNGRRGRYTRIAGIWDPSEHGYGQSLTPAARRPPAQRRPLHHHQGRRRIELRLGLGGRGRPFGRRGPPPPHQAPPRGEEGPQQPPPHEGGGRRPGGGAG